MIDYRQGDMFAFAAEAEALVNTVNCVGVMGRGIALQCKRAFPENFKAYAAACKRGEVQPGRMFIFETGQMTNPRYIVNFPTKRHWRGKSRMEDIDAGLNALSKEIHSRGIRVPHPTATRQRARADWIGRWCAHRIEATLRQFEDLTAIVYEPGGGPTDTKANPSTDVPRMTPARVVVVSLMDRYLHGLLDPFVTLLEVHKLMYFMQVAGEPLRLRFTKGHYGPYATNLRHLFHAIEGHLVSGYADGVDSPGKPLELVPGALFDAQAFLTNRPAIQGETATGVPTGGGVRVAIRHGVAGHGPLGRQRGGRAKRR